MKWELEFGGDTEEALNRQLELKGKLDPILARKPELGFSDTLIWEAYSILHSGRSSGFGVSGIPVSEIRAIAFMTAENEVDLIQIIKYMDYAYLEWASNKE